MTQIEYLADHQAMAPLLASWHHAEWDRYYSNWSLDQALAELRTHSGHRQIPTTFVALEDGRLVGSASLLTSDLDGWDHLTPWLASVYVIPERRGHRIGQRLVARVLDEATALGFPFVYLWTAGQRGYYERLNFECLTGVQNLHADVTIMRRVLSARSESIMTEGAIHVRPATIEDIPLILRFIRKKAEFDGCPEAVEATPEKLRDTLFGATPLACILFAELDGVAVGFASYFSNYSTFLARPGIWLDDLYVNEDRRSQGIGRALLCYLARLAKDRDCGRIEWTAAIDNTRGIDFYLTNGARISETVRLCRLNREAIARLAE